MYPVQRHWLPEGDQVKWQKLELASDTLEQLFHIMTQNQKFSQGLAQATAALKKWKPI